MKSRQLNKLVLVPALLLVFIAGCGGSSGDGPATGGEDPAIGGEDPTTGGNGLTTGSRAITRGADFFGTTERFNRYYTDPSYEPIRRIFVSPDGDGSGGDSDPMSVNTAFSQISAGTEIRFLQGEYNGCFGVDSDSSGTYDNPVILKAEEGVTVNCCNTGRRSCFNLESADHVAIDGFHLDGGDYGVRSVGGYATSEHQTGVAILNSHGENQNRDPFFTGGSDWAVVDNNVANNAGSGDGHGIYLSNGGDWMIVRNNELYDNESSDLQINADPISTCEEEGIAYTDPRCDGSAIDGLGQGVSEFILVENNYLHDSEVGPNFTSVRNSVIRNNIFGFYSNHNTSFWQETDNPNLGSSNNTIEHNLFIGENSRHALQLINNSSNNTIRNNLLLGVTRNGSSVTANSNTVLIEQDDSTENTNIFAGNYLVGGRTESFTPSASDELNNSFNVNWFASFPIGRTVDVSEFKPTANAPFIGHSGLLGTTTADIAGTTRFDPADPGPWKSDVENTPAAPTGTPLVDNQFVTYSFQGRAWLAEAQQGGDIIDVTSQLDALSTGGDRQINISPDGEWLLLESERFHDACTGWACLIYGKRDMSEFAAVVTVGGDVIHPEGFSAINSDGNLIVAHISNSGRNDLMVSRRTGDVWSALESLTTGSPSNDNRYPAISADGQEVLFHCGQNICIVNVDGSSLRTLLSLDDRPGGGSWEEIRSADFDSVSGDIIFEADDGSERIWRYNQDSGAISIINATHTNDNSSCVLPNGQIASLWLNRPGNSEGLHELKVMDSDGANHFLVLQDQDVSDVGIGCGGR